MNELLRAITTGVTAVPRLMGPSPMFYSRLQRAAESLPPLMKADSLVNALKRYPEGVSQVEMNWSGLPEFVKERAGKVVAKPELIRKLEQEIPRVSIDKDPNVFSEYVMKPGDDRYMVTLIQDETPSQAKKFGHYFGPHFDAPNVAVHTRTTDRNLEKIGKTKFLDELQSDWHQDGRDLGYANTSREKLLKEEGLWDTGEEIPDLPVPQSPFQKEWANIGLKEAIHRAAEEGSPGIAWIRGEDIANLVGGESLGQSAFYDKRIGDSIKKILESKGANNLSAGTKRMIGTAAPYNVMLNDPANARLVANLFDQNKLRDWATKLGAAEEKLAQALHSGNVQSFGFEISPKANNELYKLAYAANVEPRKYVSDFMTDLRRSMIKNTEDASGATAHFANISPQVRARILREGFPLL